MNAYIYVITRDYGFAPNPFYGVCTLATCKPGVRKSAQNDDWVFGIGSKKSYRNRLIYAMQIDGKITFNQYWEDAAFGCKKPSLTTLKKMYGDNIYHHDGKQWHQENSHHSLENGSPNIYNLRRDTKCDGVLISRRFYYFGREAILIPTEFRTDIYKNCRGYRKDTFGQIHQRFVRYLGSRYIYGYHGDPVLFERYARYDGRS